MALYNNDAHNTRTDHKTGATVGKQGGHGTGKVKCGADGSAKAAANFKPASQVLGEEVVGEHDVPGVSIVKGASTVQFAGAKKGSEGKPLSGKVKKPKAAEEAGH